MEKITIEFETINAAFVEGETEIEVARILKELANIFEEGHKPKSIRDLNGNKVGTVKYE